MKFGKYLNMEHLNENLDNIKARLFDKIYKIIQEDKYTVVRQHGLIVDIIEREESRLISKR